MRLRKIREQMDPVGTLMSDLNRANLGGSGSARLSDSIVKADSGFDQNPSGHAFDNGMSDAIASQEFSLDLQSGGVHDTSRLSSEQKAQLKDAFKDIQGDLKKLYSQALWSPRIFCDRCI